MSSIAAVETALPDSVFSLAQVSQIGASWLKDSPESLKLFERFLRSSNTQSRHFVISGEEMLQLNGMQYRHELFEKFGPQLGTQALQAALNSADITPRDLSNLVFTSCSCPSIPAIDALVVERAGLPRHVSRLPVYQHGCAGGVVGLEIAADLAKVRGPVALTSVELCTLVFQPGNPTPAQLVGSAIFADGAACAIVSPENRGLTFRAQQSYLVPQSRHLMGYDTFDDGFHLRLDRDLPRALTEVAPSRVREFLEASGLTARDIKYWLFHPGGSKILDFLEQTFSLQPEQCHWSRDVLQTVGNLSSATILFVLKSFLDSKVVKHGDQIMMLGVGPGLTLELIRFEWLEPSGVA